MYGFRLQGAGSRPNLPGEQPLFTKGDSFMRRVTRPFLVLLAVLFLAEAWLWDRLGPLFRRAVAALPFERVKAALAERIDRLPPYAALALFLLPLALGVPIKCGELWLLTHHHWTAAVLAIVLAKFFGMGLFAFIFDCTRDKVLAIGWFAAAYRFVLRVYHAAHELVAPIKADIEAKIADLRGCSKGDFACFYKRLRRRSLAAYRSCDFTGAA